MGVRELASAAKVSTDTVAGSNEAKNSKNELWRRFSALWNRPELSSSKRTAEVPACDCGNGVRRKVGRKLSDQCSWMCSVRSRNAFNQSTRFPEEIPAVAAALKSARGCTDHFSMHSCSAARSTGSRCAAMHAASPLSTHRGRHARFAGDVPLLGSAGSLTSVRCYDEAHPVRLRRCV